MLHRLFFKLGIYLAYNFICCVVSFMTYNSFSGFTSLFSSIELPKELKFKLIIYLSTKIFCESLPYLSIVCIYHFLATMRKKNFLFRIQMAGQNIHQLFLPYYCFTVIFILFFTLLMYNYILPIFFKSVLLKAPINIVKTVLDEPEKFFLKNNFYGVYHFHVQSVSENKLSTSLNQFSFIRLKRTGHHSDLTLKEFIHCPVLIIFSKKIQLENCTRINFNNQDNKPVIRYFHRSILKTDIFTFLKKRITLNSIKEYYNSANLMELSMDLSSLYNYSLTFRDNKLLAGLFDRLFLIISTLLYLFLGILLAGKPKKTFMFTLLIFLSLIVPVVVELSVIMNFNLNRMFLHDHLFFIFPLVVSSTVISIFFATNILKYIMVRSQ